MSIELGIAIGVIVVLVVACIYVIRKERQMHKDILDKWAREVEKGEDENA